MNEFDVEAHVTAYREHRRSLGDRAGEWLACTLGGFPGPFVYGTFEPPVPGQDMIARFRFADGGWSQIMVVRRLRPGCYQNRVGGATFEWPDDRVVVYSGVARVSGPVRVVKFRPSRLWQMVSPGAAALRRCPVLILGALLLAGLFLVSAPGLAQLLVGASLLILGFIAAVWRDRQAPEVIDAAFQCPKCASTRIRPTWLHPDLWKACICLGCQFVSSENVFAVDIFAYWRASSDEYQVPLMGGI